MFFTCVNVFQLSLVLKAARECWGHTKKKKPKKTKNYNNMCKINEFDIYYCFIQNTRRHSSGTVF